ncbi:M55 family metallopeptidase [Streptomyces sp. SID685]|uniref:M55 family metallopeptidase n=1 Tax=Streptomyces sp. SID685 TaxID=2690322 RepID=UPI001F2A4057|nr:M55 family metallopeptidase [Streptomyces sp. SID685]
MRVHVSADMEGVTGLAGAADVQPGGRDHGRGRSMMAEDMNAAVRGALAAGAHEILVHDAHGPTRDLRPDDPHPRACAGTTEWGPPVAEAIRTVRVTGSGLPTVYISGDNASLDLVREIAARYAPVDTAVLFAGAPRLSALDDALLVLDGQGAAAAAQLLGARRVVAAHVDSWAHFTETRRDVEAAGLADRLRPA